MLKKGITIGIILLFLCSSIPLSLSTNSEIIHILKRKIESTTEDFNFDIIYINNIIAELPQGGGITFVPVSFGLLVNTGEEPITKDDLDSAQVNITSNIEGASLIIGFNPYNLLEPLQSNYAWGSINSQNYFLIDFLEYGEEVQNMTPSQTFLFMIERDNYIGNATFDISIQIRKRVAYLETNITYVDSPSYYVQLLSGGRVDSWPLNQPPVAHFTAIVDELSAIFNATTSYDPDGIISTWLWDFGDGVEAAGEIVTHDYHTSGKYNVSITVIDDDGAEDNFTQEIMIRGYTKGIIFGRVFNLTSDDYNIVFEAVNIRVITFAPFSWIPYASGEEIAISKVYSGFVGYRYILALCRIQI